MPSPAFEVVAPFAPAGDQPRAIAQLTSGLVRGDKFQTLLGVTGSGKTMTLAHTIANYGKPAAGSRPRGPIAPAPRCPPR